MDYRPCLICGWQNLPEAECCELCNRTIYSKIVPASGKSHLMSPLAGYKDLKITLHTEKPPEDLPNGLALRIVPNTLGGQVLLMGDGLVLDGMPLSEWPFPLEEAC